MRNQHTDTEPNHDTTNDKQARTKKARRKDSKSQKKSKKSAQSAKNTAIHERSTDKKGIIGQIIVFSLLVALLLSSAIAVTRQVNLYRKSFVYSKELRNTKNQLNTEWHRLLLEQQTFGATTKIGGRAVVTMGMYSPKPDTVFTLNIDKSTDKNDTNK